VTATAELTRGSRSDPSEEWMVDLRDVFCVHRTGQGDAAALQGTTLRVRRGELVCVLGPSGAGKSTLLRVIAGLQIPSAGAVRLEGRDMSRLSSRRRARLRAENIGFLGQRADTALAPELRVREAIALPLALRGRSSESRRARVLELLEAAGLEGRGDALPAELSGGERQRVALCAALAHRPALLLADEPTGELDAASAERMRNLIGELARAHGTTAIVVSHDPDAASFADRTIRLRDGRIVADDRGSDGGLVVGGGGWLQVAPELLEEAKIAGRARVRLTADGLLITPAQRTDDPASGTPSADEALPMTAPDWDPAVLEVRSLRRARGRGANRRVVIAGLDRIFSPGRMTVVTGRSGAGKTTLLRVLAGLDRPEAGEVLLDSGSLASCDPEQLAAVRRERVGYLPQEPSPIGFLSAQENVALALRLRGWNAAEADRRAAAVLGWLGLSERAAQRVARLSAGEAQRVALARALASARGLLIVDEPTSRLDQATAATVAELLAAAASQDHQTVICATHDAELVRRAHDVLELGAD
jgi:ABC-type lipoprotein export system ATPase subunit